MKNKLLLTTAIVSGLTFGGSAMSQTTITGGMDLAFKAHSYDAAGGVASKRGFGRETQVNIANRGKLVNGMEYAAGFALEFDGQPRASASGAEAMTAGNEVGSISNEGVYINITPIAGTTIHVGVDSIQNSTRTVPQVLEVLDHVANGLGMSARNTVGANPKENMGVGIIQVVPSTGLTASFLYTPNGGDFGLNDQNADGATNHRNSAYEFGVVGTDTAGIKGLGVFYFQNKEDKSREGGVDLIDKEGKSYGISYSMSGITGGYSLHKSNRATTATAAEADTSAKTYALTYALTKDITLGLTRMTNNSDGAASSERINAIQLGYNLGPISLAISGADASGINYANNSDAKEFGARLTARF
jgi:hypothetical protein